MFRSGLYSSVCLTLMFFSLGVVSWGDLLSSGRHRSAGSLEVTVVRQPGVPFTITRAIATSDIVLRKTSIHLAVENTTREHIKEVSIFVAVLDGQGQPRGGQRTSQRISLRPDEEQHITFDLSNLLFLDPTRDAARISLAIDGWVGEDTAALQPYSERALLQAILGLTSLPSQPAHITSVQDFEPLCDESSFCDNCQNRATTLCGSRGVGSFNCTFTRESCSCSFTCAGGR